MTNYGKLFADIRKNIGLSQEELAKKWGVSVRTVNRWENSEKIPTMATLLIKAELLLFGEKESNEEKPNYDTFLLNDGINDCLVSKMTESEKNKPMKSMITINIMIIWIICL